MKAADIPDDALPAVVAAIQRDRGRWAFLSELQAALPDVPPKVVQAKARRLVDRGVLSGCACGCRGDFEIKRG